LKRLPRFEAMEREVEVVARSAPTDEAPSHNEAPAATAVTAGAEQDQVQDAKLRAEDGKSSAEADAD
ncbi:MAG: hypothetical protein WCZ66_12210, partial [Sphingomonadaceae bacterium]